jgi:hypothetical protein
MTHESAAHHSEASIASVDCWFVTSSSHMGRTLIIASSLAWSDP